MKLGWDEKILDWERTSCKVYFLRRCRIKKEVIEILGVKSLKKEFT